MHLKNRQFYWGLTLFIIGIIVFFVQIWTFIYTTFNTIQLAVELGVLALALAFIFVGGKVVNKTLE